MKYTCVEGVLEIPGVGTVEVSWYGSRNEGEFCLAGIKDEAAFRLIVERLTRSAILETQMVGEAAPGTITVSSNGAVAVKSLPAAPPASPKEDLTKLSAAEIDKKFPVPGPLPPSAPVDGEDYAAFAAMDNLKEVVKELVRRGKGDYASILPEAQKIQDGGTCPMLTRIGATLPDRLLVTCSTLKSPT